MTTEVLTHYQKYKDTIKRYHQNNPKKVHEANNRYYHSSAECREKQKLRLRAWRARKKLEKQQSLTINPV